MKLYFSQTSPYARKVRLAAERLGLTDRIELVPAVTTPIAEDAGLAAVSPLAKIPALVLDDGTALFDSRVILEYLDHLSGGRLVPASGPERWRALLSLRARPRFRLTLRARSPRLGPPPLPGLQRLRPHGG